jgi:outer membrane protein TolC
MGLGSALRALPAAIVVALAMAPARAHAEEPPAAAPVKPGSTLTECLALAERNHPNIAVARSRTDGFRAQLDEVRWAPFTNFTITAGAGPAPTFRGGPVYTQDREVGLSSNLGMGWRASFDGQIPIWTFGKITSGRRAAEAQVEVGEADTKMARAAVRTDVRRAYYGLQLARDGLALLKEATDKLDSALESLRKRIKAGDGDDIDLLRLETARAELEGRVAEAQKGERIALAALRFYTGQETIDVPDTPLRPPRHELGTLETYLAHARGYRPELAKARAGLVAREALVDLAKARMLPDIGLALSWTYSRAPEITDQLNPFVRDDANYLRYGVALGLQWKLDFPAGAARVRQADAALDETRHLYRFALGGIATEVEKAWSEATESRKKADAYQRASKFARQWLIKVAQGIDVGASEERDLVDPARMYALQRYNYLSALMDLNMAMANLAEKAGWDEIAETAP